MPITFLKNVNGKFVNITSKTGISNKTGWWNSIVAGDFRHTGRMDYIVGNLGRNSLFQPTEQYPVYITAKDFDKSGFSAVPSLFLPDKNGVKREFPMHGRDDMLKQMISVKKKFTDYKSYASATMEEIFSAEQMQGALRLAANTLQSCYLRNDGNDKFTIIPLPVEAQFSVLNGMVADDFDGDGNLDVVLNGNDYGTDVSIGRYDALNGLFLKGDGKGNFKPLSILESGIYIPGNGKGLAELYNSKGKVLVAASQNRDKVKVFELSGNLKALPVNTDDMYAVITYRNGTTSKQEFYFGSSFLSQSSRFILLNGQIKSVSVKNRSGLSRTIY
jgi:hypothetical protein